MTENIDTASPTSPAPSEGPPPAVYTDETVSETRGVILGQLAKDESIEDYARERTVVIPRCGTRTPACKTGIERGRTKATPRATNRKRWWGGFSVPCCPS
jgi:hypothetical protein